MMQPCTDVLPVTEPLGLRSHLGHPWREEATLNNSVETVLLSLLPKARIPGVHHHAQLGLSPGSNIILPRSSSGTYEPHKVIRKFMTMLPVCVN